MPSPINSLSPYEQADYLLRTKKAHHHRCVAGIPQPTEASYIREFNGVNFVVLVDVHGFPISVSKIQSNGRLRLRRRWPKEIEHPQPTLARALDLEQQSRQEFESLAAQQYGANGEVSQGGMVSQR